MSDERLTRRPVLDPAVADLLANMEQKHADSQLTRSERKKRNRERAKIAARREQRATYDLPPSLRQSIKVMAEKERLPASQLVTLALIRFLEDIKAGEVDLSEFKEPSSSPRYDDLLLSAISLWEFCKLLEKKRLGISCDPEEWLAQALEMPKLRVVPLTPAIAYHSTVLPQPFHEDPADQIIVSTAREENATIITKDKLMRGYKHVKSLW